MFRTSLLTLTLTLTACGIDPTIPAVQDEAALVAATPAPTLPGEQAKTAAPVRLRFELDTVQVHSLAVPDGSHVQYVIGVMGCGISVSARGTATVQGGAFTIPFDPAGGSGEASLFFMLGDTCDAEASQVYEVPVAMPGSVDLSTLPESAAMGCWLFE